MAWQGRIVGCLLVLSLPAVVSSVPDETTANAARPAFDCVPLGVAGGLVDGNLSAYLVARAGRTDYLCLDAGTVTGGLEIAARKGAFAAVPGASARSPRILAGEVLRRHVRGYAISHPHLDHVAGLVISSPDDSAKPVFGLPATLATIGDHLFNGAVWANFADSGVAPVLAKYHFVQLAPWTAVEIPATGLELQAAPLSHGGKGRSTAFLVSAGDACLLYLGDVGSDAVEGGNELQAVWRRVAPLVRSGALRAVFLECSYANGRPPEKLFGHLTPEWFLHELEVLAATVDPQHPETALAGLQFVVTHIKPSFDLEPPPEDLIPEQLEKAKELGVKLVLPVQGQLVSL